MNSNLVWIDLEMSGLNPTSNVILEIAALVTDPDLNVLGEGLSLVIFQDDEHLDAMDAWNIKHHSESGLINQVRASEISIEEAEAVVYDYVSRHTKERKSPLCGNSVGLDRSFLKQYMQTLEAHLHYRNIDVSSIKELVFRWAPELRKQITKHNKHRALDDIQESIRELQFYRQHFINPAYGPTMTLDSDKSN